MAKTTDLSVAKSEGLARIMAVSVWHAAGQLDTTGDPLRKAVQDAMVLHAHELLGLHDIKADEVLTGAAGNRAADNGYVPLPDRDLVHES